MFQPGRARLATMPLPTRSSTHVLPRLGSCASTGGPRGRARAAPGRAALDPPEPPYRPPTLTPSQQKQQPWTPWWPGSSLTGHRTLGVTQFLQGEPEPARGNLDQAMALYEPESHLALALRFGQVPLSACQAMLSPVLWLLGFAEASVQSSEEGLASARAGGPFNTVAYAIYFGALIPALFRRDFDAPDRHARALMTIAAEQGAAFSIAAAAMAEGLIQVRRGESERGLARFSRAREDWHATGSRFNDPRFAAVLADLHLQGGRVGEGLTAIDEALALAHGSAGSAKRERLARHGLTQRRG
jgi:hypothetical protein